jgi:hypothetical protein
MAYEILNVKMPVFRSNDQPGAPMPLLAPGTANHRSYIDARRRMTGYPVLSLASENVRF